MPVLVLRLRDLECDSAYNAAPFTLEEDCRSMFNVTTGHLLSESAVLVSEIYLRLEKSTLGPD